MSAKPFVDQSVLNTNELRERVLARPGALQPAEEALAPERNVVAEHVASQAHEDQRYLTTGKVVNWKAYGRGKQPLPSPSVGASKAKTPLGPLSDFGKRIQEACEDLGMTTWRLAQILQISDAYMARVLRKKPIRGDTRSFSMGPEWTYGLPHVLGVRWQWLFFGEEPKWPPDGAPTAQSAGIKIAELEESREYPTLLVNEAVVREAAQRLTDSGFKSDHCWEWSAAIRAERRVIESAKNAASVRKKIEEERERDAKRGQSQLRRDAEKRRKQIEDSKEPTPAPPPASAKPRRLGRVKMR